MVAFFMQLFREQRLLTSLCASTPPPLRRVVLGVAGAILFLLDVDKCRSSVLRSIEDTFPEKGKWYAMFTAIRATVTSLTYTTTALYLSQLPNRLVATKIQDRVSVTGLANLHAAREMQKGVVLVSSHFACFYIALIARHAEQEADESRAADTLVVAVPPMGEQEWNFFRKLQTLATDHRLEAIEHEKPRAGIEFLAALRSKKIVACMIDNVRDGGAHLFVDFLGADTAFPAGPFAIAAKYDIPIVPVHVEACGSLNQHVVHFGAPLRAPHLQDFDSRLQAISAATARYFADVVRKHPGSWESWRTLAYRRKLHSA